jgi:hypothetical protein
VTCPPTHRRCAGGIRGALAAIAACACLASGCSRGADSTPALAIQPASAPAAGEVLPHGDHNPHFGGLVLMNGDLHFEVVLGRDGSKRLYFSDATRNELPAATASDVTITITRTSQAPEVVALHINESGESWTGRGRPVGEPDATARIAYTARGKPYFIDVPFPR